jgi:DNA-binding MarR family transcriptional regulator
MVDAQELARLISEFGKAYTRRVWSEMTRAGTTPARARLLAALQCEGCRKMSELGVELGVTPRNITKLVDGLEAEGLVARQAHPSDRRATLVCITEEGKRVGKESALADGAAAAWLYKQLGPANSRHLARILRKLLASLDVCGADEVQHRREGVR